MGPPDGRTELPVTRGRTIQELEYRRLDALALADLIRRGEVSPRELVDTALGVADRVNPAINAIIHRLDVPARARADQGAGDGPFAGVPFLVKDLIQLMAGEPFRCGSRFLEHFVPDHDGELLRRFRAAGLIPIGKTNTPEFGLAPYTEPELFGPTRNPWDPGFTSGGSSGGSAAAVAAGIVPIASGGDGGGSIRIPASCCGVFGLKPTRGRLPTGPDFGELWAGAVVEHVLTRSVRDSAAALDATHGGDPGAPYLCTAPERPYLEEVRREPGRLRIAVSTTPWLGSTVHPDCVAAVEDAARLLESLGHVVEEASPSIDGPAVSRAFLSMVCSECAADISDAARITGRPATRDRFEAATWALQLIGRSLRADELSEALRVLGQVSRTVGQFFERWDLLLTPVLATPPFPVGALQPKPGERRLLEILGGIGSGRLIRMAGLLEQLAAKVYQVIPYTPLFNITGQPAMSVPLWWNAQGLPVGVQLVARFADDGMLFRVAGQLERARPWADRRPPEPSR